MSTEADSVSIRVVARFRPLNDKERAMGMGMTYKFVGDEVVNINVSTTTFKLLQGQLSQP